MSNQTQHDDDARIINADQDLNHAIELLNEHETPLPGNVRELIGNASNSVAAWLIMRKPVKAVYTGGHGGLQLQAFDDHTIEVRDGNGRLYVAIDVRKLYDADHLTHLVDVARMYNANSAEKSMLVEVYRAARLTI